MVTRRTLSKLAGGALLGGLAGCIGRGTAEASPADRKRTGTPNGTPRTDSTADPGGPAHPFDPGSIERVVTIPGSAGGEGTIEPHGVSVWNDADEPRTIDVGIVPAGDGPLGSATLRLELAADAAASVSLRAPDDYEVRVRVPARESPATVRVGAERFDCNASTTNVRVGPDGAVDSRVISTMLACNGGPVTGTPEGADRES